MFLNRPLLHSSLIGLVGADQTTNPEYSTLATSLLTSRSGRYWNREHPLLTIENIDQCITNFSRYQYTEYSALTEYSLYDKVKRLDVNYQYINATPSTGNQPPNATYWEVIDNLSDYLLEVDTKATDMAVDAVMNHKKVKGEVKSIFNNVLLFSGVANYNSTIANEGKLVGLKITLKESRSLAVILHKIGHQFDGTLEDLTIYLYHTSQKSPLTSFTIDHSTALSSQWTSLSNYVIKYLSDNHDIGGSFFLGYFQDDLDTVKALKKDLKFDQYYKPSSDPRKDYKAYSPFVNVVGFEIPSTYLDGTDLPNADFEGDSFVTYDNNFGLNLQFSSKCDLSPFLIQQEEVLAEVKSISFAYLILQAMAYSTRGSNAVANLVMDRAKEEIFNHTEARGTIKDKLDMAIKALDFDLSGLDDYCLPCNDSVQVDFSSL